MSKCRIFIRLLLITCLVIIFIQLNWILFDSTPVTNEQTSIAPANSTPPPIWLSESAINSSNSQLVLRQTNAFITSAYFYENSRSLGRNAVALVLLLSQLTTPNLTDYKLTIVGINGQESEKVVAKMSKEATRPSKCEYVTVLAQANFNMERPATFAIESMDQRVEIPMREPRKFVKNPVVICISPLFLAEKWQLFLMHIHVIQRYQGHMHLYITSMIQPFFEMVKLYEKLGLLTIEYWLRMKFNQPAGTPTDPNRSVEWRNQAGAQTDCLLQYKEAADFVAFFDLDDILIPRYSYNYYQEFSTMYQSVPSYHYLFYWKRNVMIEKVPSADKFSFKKIFASMTVNSQYEYGKTVTHTSRLNSTWIHHPRNVPLEEKIQSYTELTHIKDYKETFINEASNELKSPFIANTNNDPLIRESDILALEKEFQIARRSSQMKETMQKLKYQDVYGSTIFKCYNETMYYPWFKLGYRFDKICPNADYCQIPQYDNVKCVHSDAKYVSGPSMFPITYHYAIEPYWSTDFGCQM